MHRTLTKMRRPAGGTMPHREEDSRGEWLEGQALMRRSPGERGTGSLHVLVVERDAHRQHGHYPSLFASVASSFAELGCVVDVVTQRGWLFADANLSPPAEN